MMKKGTTNDREDIKDAFRRFQSTVTASNSNSSK